MAKAKKQDSLAKTPGAAISKSGRVLSVGDLESALLKAFPADHAENWDVVGLTVGEPAVATGRVAVALDASVQNIRAAAAAGANVLVTHHPPYLQGPTRFAPGASAAQSPGAVVWAAIANRVALINCHTNLDVSPKAQAMLPGMLGLAGTGRVAEPINFKGEGEGVAPRADRGARGAGTHLGFGAICKPGAADGNSITLAHLAARCISVFGRAPRVWGDNSRKLKTIVCATGSAGPTGRAAFEAGADCLICGEVKYHDALDLSQAGMCIIELGHDVSELPLAAVLAGAVADAGVASDKITILDEQDAWHTPESIRL